MVCADADNTSQVLCQATSANVASNRVCHAQELLCSDDWALVCHAQELLCSDDWRWQLPTTLKQAPTGTPSFAQPVLI